MGVRRDQGGMRSQGRSALNMKSEETRLCLPHRFAGCTTETLRLSPPSFLRCACIFMRPVSPAVCCDSEAVSVSMSMPAPHRCMFSCGLSSAVVRDDAGGGGKVKLRRGFPLVACPAASPRTTRGRLQSSRVNL